MNFEVCCYRLTRSKPLCIVNDLNMRIRKKTITGLYQRDKTFFWTTLSRGNDGSVASRTFRRTLDVEDDVLADPAALGLELKKQCPELVGQVVYALPAARVLFKVMDLPVCDPQEMDSMIRLQMDKISPFPDDHLVVAYEVLRETETNRRVLLAGAQKGLIDSVGTLCSAAGLDLCRIDSEAIVWWQVLQACEPAPLSERHVLGIVEHNQTTLFTLQDKLPLAFNFLHNAAGLTADEYAAELIHEVYAVNLALDIEQEPAPLSRLKFWPEKPPLANDSELPPWHTQVAEALKCEIEYISLEALPDLSAGIARRFFEPPFQPRLEPAGAEAVLDFIPTEWRKTAAARSLRKKLLLTSFLILLLWALGMSVFFGGYYLTKKHTERLDAEIQALKEPSEAVRVLQSKMRSFEQSLERRRLALESLREISQLLPKGAILTSFQFRRNRSVILRGEAENVDPIYDFKEALDQSPLFDKVDMGSVQPGKRRDVTVQTFQMNAQYPEALP